MISPPPSSIFCSSRDHYIDHTYLASVLNVHFQGMTTMIIAPLTTIKQQIEDDCRLYGISALVGDQVKFVCSMIFRSSVNHETISVAYQMVGTIRSHSDPVQQSSSSDKMFSSFSDSPRPSLLHVDVTDRFLTSMNQIHGPPSSLS